MEPKRRDDGRYEAGDRIFDTEEAARLHLEHLGAQPAAPAPTETARSRVPALIVAAVAVVAAAAWGVSYWPKYKIQQRVKVALFDPDSAKFEGITYNWTIDVGCGYVNAKNKMGGYVGTTMFIAFGHGGVEFAPQEVDSSRPTTELLENAQKRLAFLEKAQTFCSEDEKPQSTAAPVVATTVPGVTQEDIRRALEDGRKQASEKAEPVNWPKPPDNLTANASAAPATEAAPAGPVQIYGLSLGGKPPKPIRNCTMDQVADRKTLCWIDAPMVYDGGSRYGSINLPEAGLPAWAVNASHKLSLYKDGTITAIYTDGKYAKGPEISGSISSRFGPATEREGSLTIWSTPSVRVTFLEIGEDHREVRFQTPAAYARDRAAQQKRKEQEAARPKAP